MSDYLKRKIDKELESWLKEENHSPALIYGIRQCGKSRSIKEFAESHFKYVNLINFWSMMEAKDIFEGSLQVDDLIKKMSAHFPSWHYVPKETIFIFDEIQDCPLARLSLKSFKEDGRFEVIASGSYIGLNIGSASSSRTPLPNGAEDIICMKTMDFEEFLWAKGYQESVVSDLLHYFEKREPVPISVHKKMQEIFKEYMCVGGFPESVYKYVKSHNLALSFKKNESLIFDIKGDPLKRKDDNGTPLYTAAEVSRIQKAFDLIKAYSVNDNRRFVLSNISGNSIQKGEAIDYLLNSSIAIKAKNVENPSLPLSLMEKENDFKLFYCDISLLIASCGYDTIKALFADTLGMNKGAIYEQVLAESLYKANIPLHYFAKPSGLEIDFLISYEGYSCLIEAKAKSGNVKSSKTVMAHPEHYGKTKLIKFGDYNISQEGDVMTLPYYLAFALGK